MVRIAAFALLVAASFLAPQPPGIGSIHGRVEIDAALVAPARRPETRELGSRSPAPLTDRRKAVVYLDLAAKPSAPPAPMRATMDQRQEAFVPRVLAVTVGSTIDFPNSDPTYHNVFSLSRAKRFDLGRYAAGRSKSVRFDEPGVVRIFCDIHSHMSAYILVFSHRFFGVTDADGRFRIDTVPAGSHTLKVWTEVLPVRSGPVVVPAGGETEVRLSLSRDAER